MKSGVHRIRVITAGLVITYRGKFLLLYDGHYKHYVQSYGHTRKSESYRQTAWREAREETGFKNIEIIRKIGQYRYNFLRNNVKTYKTVHVFLARLQDLKKMKSKTSFDRKYSPHFFTASEAIKKCRWPQDKKLLQIAKKIKT
ncbi:MAG: NUDIX domain-containing protein [Patescibacteria group bacterium]